MLISAESLKAEESRIRQAYARRLRSNLYSRFNPAHLFLVQERERRILSLLCREGCAPLETKKILEIGCGNELPQLINVLKGEMTFVVPRPEVRRFVELFRDDYAEF